MSGESPREVKVVSLATCTVAGAGVTVATTNAAVTTTLVAQRSRQQLMACWPLGQQESCDVCC